MSLEMEDDHQAITVVAGRASRLVHDGLHCIEGTLRDHIEGEDALTRPVYRSDEIDATFLSRQRCRVRPSRSVGDAAVPAPVERVWRDRS